MPTSPNKSSNKNPETNPQIPRIPTVATKEGRCFGIIRGFLWNPYPKKKKTSTNPRIFARGQHLRKQEQEQPQPQPQPKNNRKCTRFVSTSYFNHI